MDSLANALEGFAPFVGFGLLEACDGFRPFFGIKKSSNIETGKTPLKRYRKPISNSYAIGNLLDLESNLESLWQPFSVCRDPIKSSKARKACMDYMRARAKPSTFSNRQKSETIVNYTRPAVASFVVEEPTKTETDYANSTVEYLFAEESPKTETTLVEYTEPTVESFFAEEIPVEYTAIAEETPKTETTLVEHIEVEYTKPTVETPFAEESPKTETTLVEYTEPTVESSVVEETPVTETALVKYTKPTVGSLAVEESAETDTGVLLSTPNIMSSTSSAYITAVKSTTASIVSVASPLRSHRRSRLPRSTDFGQSSGEDTPILRALDDAATKRAIERRYILKELLHSESSYVSDLKVYANIYMNILGSVVPSMDGNITQSLTHNNNNIKAILALHEEFLLQIHKVMFNAGSWDDLLDMDKRGGLEEYRHPHGSDITSSYNNGIVNRTKKAPETLKITTPSHDMIATTTPKQAADIASVFNAMLPYFAVYEQYAVQYDSLVRKTRSFKAVVPNFSVYELGIENLAKELAPNMIRSSTSRKALALSDMLMRPIQRVCKYQLMFADLLKHTPVTDCPHSYSQIRATLSKIQETTTAVDKVTNDEEGKRRMERSWALQDLIQVRDLATSQIISGDAHLCGVLHVAYQTRATTTGSYMLAALFDTHLILATPLETTGPSPRQYTVVASIKLEDLYVDDATNGEGVQCHNALHTFKVIFASGPTYYELLLSACSSQEEDAWRSSLNALAADVGESDDVASSSALTAPSDANPSKSVNTDSGATSSPSTTTTLSLKPLVSIPLDPVSVAAAAVNGWQQQTAVRRAATVGPRHTSQIIIKDTHSLSPAGGIIAAARAPPTIGRSQSLLPTRRVPVLAPKRAARARMEREARTACTWRMIGAGMDEGKARKLSRGTNGSGEEAAMATGGTGTATAATERGKGTERGRTGLRMRTMERVRSLGKMWK